jgi:hypothetical protein
MIPKMPAPHSMRGGDRFSDKIMPKQLVRTGGIEPPWQRLEGARSANDPNPLNKFGGEL